MKLLKGARHDVQVCVDVWFIKSYGESQPMGKETIQPQLSHSSSNKSVLNFTTGAGVGKKCCSPMEKNRKKTNRCPLIATHCVALNAILAGKTISSPLNSMGYFANPEVQKSKSSLFDKRISEE